LTKESNDRYSIEQREVSETRAALREYGVPAFEAEFLSGEHLVRRGKDLYVALETFRFRSGAQGSGAVEMGLRFDLFGQDRQPLHSFGVNSRFAIQAMREVNRCGEELPIPAVVHSRGGDPKPQAKLMLTTSCVQVAGEPEESQLSLCYSLARLDHSPLCTFALDWRSAVLAMGLAFTDDKEELDRVGELSPPANPHPPTSH
jgi:hypothetical protein